MPTPDRDHSLKSFEEQLRALNLSRKKELDFDAEAGEPEATEEEYYTPEIMAAFFPETISGLPADEGSAETDEPAPGMDASDAGETVISASAGTADAEGTPLRTPLPRSAAPVSKSDRGGKRPSEGPGTATPPYRTKAQGGVRPASGGTNNLGKSRPAPDSAKARAEARPVRGNAPAPAKRAKPRKKSNFHFFRFLGRTLKVVLSTVLVAAAALICAIIILTHGPSEDACRLFVLSANETSALKFVPSLFLPAEKVNAILYPEREETAPDTFVELSFESVGDAGLSAEPQELVQISEENVSDELEVIDIREKTFKGKMLIIHDPTRVRLCSINDFGIAFGNFGIYLTDFIAKSGAIAGTNAGGFYDPNGQGNGGIPDGIVIREGAIAYGSPYAQYVDVIGFDAGHVMHVGDMTGQQALDAGIVEGLSFASGPVLIQNGVKRTGLGGGVNPRTCIGQRSDGTVLLMVVEGRHPDSLGATYDDLADLMEEYGAVNAGNLDGGSSSAMIYNGEQITKGSTIIGSRTMCTAILVLP